MQLEEDEAQLTRGSLKVAEEQGKAILRLIELLLSDPGAGDGFDVFLVEGLFKKVQIFHDELADFRTTVIQDWDKFSDKGEITQYATNLRDASQDALEALQKYTELQKGLRLSRSKKKAN